MSKKDGSQLPFSEDAEAAVIASILLNPECLNEIKGMIIPTDFFLLKHKLIFEAMIRLHDSGQYIDTITVYEALLAGKKDNSETAAINGLPATMINYLNNLPTWIHIATYAGIVKRCSVRRKIIALAHEITNDALDASAVNQEETADLLRSVSAKFDKLLSENAAAQTISARKVLGNIFEQVEAALSDNPPPRISTGFKKLDNLLGGGLYSTGRPIIIYGATGMGKTWLVFNIAANVAEQGHKTLFFSTEMNPETVLYRAIQARAGIHVGKIKTGNYGDKSKGIDAVLGAIEGIENALGDNLLFDNNSGAGAAEFLALCAGAAARGVKAVVVDSIQNLAKNTKGETEQDRLSQVTNALQLAERKYGLIVIATSQVARAVSTQAGSKIPTLTSAFGTSEIEKCARVILALYYHDYYVRRNEATADPNFEQDAAYLYVLKDEIDADQFVGKRATLYRSPTGYSEVRA